MSAHLAPDEPWPKHSRPEAREALDQAAAAGWSFRKSSGHAFGRVTCPARGNPGACTVVIYSTSGPADGSETAKAIRRGLRKCPHHPEQGPAPDTSEPALSDNEITRRVERLLRAARGLTEQRHASAAREEAVDRNDEHAFDEEDRRLTEADNAARTAWHELGRPVEPWPPDVAIHELLDDAKRFVVQVVDPSVADKLEQEIHRHEN